MTDIETSRQMNKFKKKKKSLSSHYGTVAILAPSLHTVPAQSQKLIRTLVYENVRSSYGQRFI